ncbi:MAG: MarR family transcriptional regulator [candidate division KSB1 bacterium]|nr:MarR family transcriptional regulator [candidate division KSB1 bacterium]MDZ7319466.1 MarR family transcriptional regulator [candidate division KSB1 bacterium]MDZ7342421.1 MarR family transcriptional regulator [candidate division KSB1 bacterium]
MLYPANKTLCIELAGMIARLFTNCNEKESRHAAQLGLSVVEFRCLRAIFENKHLTVNQLAQAMSLTSSRITRIIDELVTRKLVSRINDKNDRRVINLSLTPEGEKLAQKSIDHYLKIHEEIIKYIPAEDHRAMIKLLEKLNRSVEHWLETE